jgi:hypothetical protein
MRPSPATTRSLITPASSGPTRFHGGLGGEQTRPFILYPVELPPPDGPIVGAEEVHRILKGWRTQLQEARP